MAADISVLPNFLLLTRILSTIAKTHATKRPIKLVSRRISASRSPTLILPILLIHNIGTLSPHRTTTRHITRSTTTNNTPPLRLQNLLLPIQPPRRDPPFLRQLLLLQPLLPFPDRPLGFFLRRLDVRL